MAGKALTIRNTKRTWYRWSLLPYLSGPRLVPYVKYLPTSTLCDLSGWWCDRESKHPVQSWCGGRSTLLSWIISQHRMWLSSALKPWTPGLRMLVLTFCIRSLITSAFNFSQPRRYGACGVWLLGRPAPTSGLSRSATAHAQLLSAPRFTLRDGSQPLGTWAKG